MKTRIPKAEGDKRPTFPYFEIERPDIPTSKEWDWIQDVI
jgi:hypothetical protein